MGERSSVDNVDEAYLKEQERVSKLPAEELKTYSLQVLTVGSGTGSEM